MIPVTNYGLFKVSRPLYWTGDGYLGGDLPPDPNPDELDGRTKELNVPTRVRVCVFERHSMFCVASTRSGSDGTWRAAYLNQNLHYTVIGFDDHGVVNAAIQDWVTPATITPSLRPFELVGYFPGSLAAGYPSEFKIKAKNGVGDISFTISDGAIPTGMTPATIGRFLVVTGTPAVGPYAFEVTAEDDDGNQVVESYEVEVIDGHLFWRIYITSNEAASYTAIQELEMRAVAGGGDLCFGGTATASSQYDASATALQVFDGDMNYFTGCWVSADTSMPQWVAYQFPAPVDVYEVAVWPQNHVAFATRGPKDFLIQYSDDGSAWTTAATFTGITGWLPATPKTFVL